MTCNVADLGLSHNLIDNDSGQVANLVNANRRKAPLRLAAQHERVANARTTSSTNFPNELSTKIKR